MSAQELAIQLVIMLVLVALSAFFSATETAFSSLNRTRVKNMAEHGDKRAAAALALPLALVRLMPGGFWGFCLSVLLCVGCAGLSVLFVGCGKTERKEMYDYLRRRKS